jgi:hypothetical protein
MFEDVVNVELIPLGFATVRDQPLGIHQPFCSPSCHHARRIAPRRGPLSVDVRTRRERARTVWAVGRRAGPAVRCLQREPGGSQLGSRGGGGDVRGVRPIRPHVELPKEAR